MSDLHPEASTSTTPSQAIESTAETLQQNGSDQATVKQNVHKVSGRDWKAPKQPTRVQRKRLTTWEERQAQRAKTESVKKIEKEMIAEKEAEKQRYALQL